MIASRSKIDTIDDFGEDEDYLKDYLYICKNCKAMKKFI